MWLEKGIYWLNVDTEIWGKVEWNGRLFHILFVVKKIQRSILRWVGNWDVHVLAADLWATGTFHPCSTHQPTDGPDRPWDPETLGAVLCAPVGLCRQTFVSAGMHLSMRLNAKLPGGSIMPPGSDTPPPFAKPDSSLGPPGRIIFPPASYWLSIAPALLAIYHSGLHHPPFVSAPIVSLSPTEE